jgi:hypothetical protein
MNNYQLLDEDWNGMQLIKLTASPYEGIIYTYGRVRLVEEDELLRVQFEYDIHKNPGNEIERESFRNYIGDILIELLEKDLLKNNIVYTGGVDENRTKDSEQSDT